MTNKTETTASGSGLWRDERHLVVDLRKHEFPNRCVKSNEPTADARTPVWLPAVHLVKGANDALASLVEQGAVSASRTAGGAQRISIQLMLPLSNEWQSKQRSWAGNVTAVLGCVGAAASFIVSFIAAMMDRWWLFIPLVVCGVFIGVALFGFVRMMRRDALFTIRRFDDDKIWVAGVDPMFLATLPAWTETAATAASRRRREKIEARASITAGIALTVMAIVLLAIFIPIFLEGQASSGWPAAEGIIAWANMQEKTGYRRYAGRYTFWELELSYEFKVAGIQYTGTQYSIDSSTLRSSNQHEVTGQLHRYRRGSPVTVYYDPADPTHCVLQPGHSVGSAVISCLGGLMLLMGCLVFGFGAYRSQAHHRRNWQYDNPS